MRLIIMSRMTQCASCAGLFLVLAASLAIAKSIESVQTGDVQIGSRPMALVRDMDESPLKERLLSCDIEQFKASEFSIGHRGAPLNYPEHTRESYIAAAQMGAGIVECDVAFTKDRELVCRHAQDDLHTTTNIVTIPKLNAKCTQPFVPADPSTGTPARAECRTSDLTLAEFRQLQGKMTGSNPMATSPEAYIQNANGDQQMTRDRRGTVMTHRESIELFQALGVKFTPELKSPVVDMPFEGEYSQKAYARQMIQDYIDAGIHPAHVWPQSFNLEDVLFWIEEMPEFGRQAVLLDSDATTQSNTSVEFLKRLKAQGVHFLAPPLWKLLSTDEKGHIVPSAYAKNARTAGLNLIAWTVERSGSLDNGGGWYYSSVTEAINNDGDVLTVIDVLAQDVGVVGVFSDWPATTTFYANCMGLADPD
ncbi:glycerophosphodiester phosphodiesterase family protein [Marinobacter sp. CHS3-4]|uniref:glycerophosphodiester phosphodiesterase family protein n=1 Tax=Marinobacter sp. CHS3-4 TaxID=3045174 RepID=UPI0024B60F8C|nr:glycerophosphodiester phosphodiesterase family protein [Marinobacter sp. CHS3-4]MDI9246526.1 glycerophosphodiester phosphodiesterase family protein [Marinobacter sp. CHS3-4]